jgi:hypothetical protein
VSFASEPGRDDSNLPPVNIVVPDDARELDRDVLAYRRELRAQRRRQRLGRLFRPLRLSGLGGNTAVIPLIAICLAISLVGGALLSVATMSPASAPTLSGSQPSATPGVRAGRPAPLPAGSVRLDGIAVPVRTLVTSVIALVPAGCDCGPQLQQLAEQAVAADVKIYFVAGGNEIGQLTSLTVRYGDGAAVAAADSDNVLTAAYRPAGLTVLLVFKDATAEVLRQLPPGFQLTSDLRELAGAGASLRTTQPATGQPGASQPAAGQPAAT